MSHTYEKVSGNKAKLTFTVPAEQFDEAMQKAYLKLRGRISVPGFRKGKAPRSLIERMYGAEKDIARVQEQMKVANHRIDDLEKITTKA